MRNLFSWKRLRSQPDSPLVLAQFICLMIYATGVLFRWNGYSSNVTNFIGAIALIVAVVLLIILQARRAKRTG